MVTGELVSVLRSQDSQFAQWTCFLLTRVVINQIWVCIYMITSWEIDGETVETVSDFILGGSKITAVVTAVMKLKDTPWKESYDQPG